MWPKIWKQERSVISNIIEISKQCKTDDINVLVAGKSAWNDKLNHIVVKDNDIVKAELEKRHIVCIDKKSMSEIPRQPKRVTFRQKWNC